MMIYVATYAGAMLLALIATPLMVRIARWRGMLDHPGVRRVRSTAVPRLILIGALLPSLPVFRAVGAIRIRESFSTFQRNRSIARDAKGRRRGSEEMRLCLHEARTLDEWWKVLRRTRGIL